MSEPVSGKHWLNRLRLRLYCGTILLASVIYLSHCAWTNWKLFGEANGFDFATFWAASRLALDGTPLEAYSWLPLSRAAHLISPHVLGPGPWLYPPNFLLLVKPFALLPFPIAYAVFAASTAIMLLWLLRRILPWSAAILPILGFPGIWLNIVQGQNACLTASLALGAFMLLEKRPILAGLCIGMLSIKPHLAILFPVALACAGMWTAFIAAAVTTVVFTGVSVAVFGAAIVPVFLHSLGEANAYVVSGALPWGQMASLLTSLRQIGVPPGPAFAAQLCAAFAALTAVIWVWRRSRELEVRAVALVAGTFLLSPYLYNYDTAWLAIPIALFTANALRSGWLRWEREILCIAWLYPALGELSGCLLHAGIGPLVFASLMFVAVRRTYLRPGGVVAREPSWPDAHLSSDCRP